MFPGVETPGYSQDIPPGQWKAACLQGHFPPTVSGQEDVGHAQVATAAPSWGTSRVLLTAAVHADERIRKS